jgi:predicted helicase
MLTFISEMPDELVKQGLDLKDTRDWKIKIARERVKKLDWKKYMRLYSYRPFDIRYICYIPDLIDRGCDRWDLMQNFFEKNLGMVTIRSESKQVDFSHSFISDSVVDIHYAGGQTYVFPLYLYPDTDKTDIFSYGKESDQKQSNISPKTFLALTSAYKKEPSPEEIFYYIYAVLYANVYRSKYAEFLKIDFPRIPFTKEYKLFSKMAEHGKRLADLHLLKSADLDPPIAKFQGKGTDRVEKVRYEDGRVYINKDQYFEGVKPEVWDYQIGGYQVCDKWLKDRKGRSLSLDDMKHYCRMVTALSKTIELQKVIDEIYSEVEKETIS